MNVWRITFEKHTLYYPYQTENQLKSLSYARHIVISNTTLYKQKFGLHMGSLLTGVQTYTHLEFLESGPFKYIIPSNSNYFRDIDDILLIYPQELNWIKITDRLNNIEPSIKFSHELESNNFLCILNVLLVRKKIQIWIQSLQ